MHPWTETGQPAPLQKDGCGVLCREPAEYTQSPNFMLLRNITVSQAFGCSLITRVLCLTPFISRRFLNTY